MTGTIFEQIISGEIPCVKIYEDMFCIAIMDKFPITKGQTLVISKKSVDKLTDLDDETYSAMFLMAKRIAQASDTALGSKRCFILVQGLEIPHAHIKVYPLYEEHIPLDEGSGKMAEDESLRLLAEKIQKYL